MEVPVTLAGMKLIQAMKLIKELQEKAADLRQKVATYCADMDFESPMYGTATEQRNQVDKWIQSHSDILKKILETRTSVQRTNLATKVSIELGGQSVEKSIAEWIHRRRDLAKEELMMWQGLGDKGLKEGHAPASAPGMEPKAIKIRRYYDPKQRDEKVELYRSEPGIIDRNLEVVNATTELVEA